MDRSTATNVYNILQDALNAAGEMDMITVDRCLNPSSSSSNAPLANTNCIGSDKDGDASSAETNKKDVKSNKCFSTKTKKDKPKRALSAYNLFFRYQRDRIVSSSPGESDIESPVVTLEQIAILAKRSIGVQKGLAKRKHRKTHGKIGFRELGRVIAEKWKCLDKKSMSIFEEIASRDKLRYKIELEAWNEKKCEEEEEEFATNDQNEYSTEGLLASSESFSKEKENATECLNDGSNSLKAFYYNNNEAAGVAFTCQQQETRLNQSNLFYENNFGNFAQHAFKNNTVQLETNFLISQHRDGHCHKDTHQNDDCGICMRDDLFPDAGMLHEREKELKCNFGNSFSLESLCGYNAKHEPCSNNNSLASAAAFCLNDKNWVEGSSSFEPPAIRDELACFMEKLEVDGF